MINQKKLLVLFGILVLFVNYQNYLRVDIKKKLLTKESTSKILEEQKNFKKNNVLISDASNSDLMYAGEKYSYSKAMGAFQNQITKNAKDKCNIEKIKWANAIASKTWYTKLRMSVALECKPDKFFEFVNAMRDEKKIFKLESMRIAKQKNKKTLTMRTIMVAYRNNKNVK